MKYAAVLLLLAALPLAAEPIFNLYDCTGRESACTELFPGERALKESFFRTGPYIQGDRTVVAGIDLGPNYLSWTPETGGPLFVALFYRDPYVIGWQASDGMDEDGRLVKWILGDGVAKIISDSLISGSAPDIDDVNSHGQMIGGRAYGFGYPAYIDMEPLHLGNVPESWGSQLVEIEHSELLRINDAGQVLGRTHFWGEPGSEPTERLILLSPLDVPFPPLPDASPINTPEPSTTVLFGAVLLACAWSRRR